jgi:uncharacterized alkaline shock family protein YloU
MPKDIQTEIGKIHLTDDVIATIAGMAAMECYSIAGMAARRFQDGLAEILGRENLSRGVKVSLEDDRLVIDLNIIVAYGTNINEVAHNVIDKVRYAVEETSSLKVDRVNVFVQGVRVAN